MKSNNMSYLYNVEYYDGLGLNDEEFFVNGGITDRTTNIVEFHFPTENIFPAEFEHIDGLQEFSLHTAYPGLMIGTGLLHEIKMVDALKNGFTFDFVTGLPFLPGSSLKGMLRSYFPEPGDDARIEYIKSCPNGKKVDDIVEFTKWIFGQDKPGNINFLGAFPQVDENDKTLLATEYITPHPSEFKEPKPVSMVKIKPGVIFKFFFVCKDYVVDKKVVVTAAELLELFEQIVLDMGIGAKTNVGFGMMVKKPSKNELLKVNAPKPNPSNNNRPQGSNRNNRR
ncbi:CRISPR-associated RAMP Cmr6 [Anaerovibrio sp. JC8]|uniref:type III-B CRISPR module RAMP protein Cmr6 n=1 Tax=Anaerovibrio sp. JC8 TaxID=1240085 RepID=UPI000A09ABA6|nr:type III-B CRISPR module RAMP protein Cmr6 [Anaerovibrio sp. JC8]ORU00263.1 CRISPR-associated RAMP Cmr6 [Anaerovibrio sp. JC8]